MLLAGDLGATKTLLGLFEDDDRRPIAQVVRTYPTQSFESFADILGAFTDDVGLTTAVRSAVIGVAGAVVDQRTRLTNVTWNVAASDIAASLGTPRVRLLNDVEAMATSIPALLDEELVTLQRGRAGRDGNAVVIAAGTGLGEAYLHRLDGGGFRVVASEGGHADFAARTDREIELLRMLRTLHGRAQIEDVVSGLGLVNLYRFTHADEDCAPCKGLPPHEIPAALTEAALTGACSRCGEALSMFVDAYGAEAGNLALRAVAVGGVYIGGGIAAKVLPALQDGRFMAAFSAKSPMVELLAAMPVRVILNQEAGLLGAAVAAHALTVAA